jgi:hypothetical protein
MRALIATLLCVVVLVGSAAYVGRHVDTAEAEAAAFRARAAQVLAEEAGQDCGCTAPTRAKDRAASQNTATTSSAN